MNQYLVAMVALLGGGLLAFMLALNSQLGLYVGSLGASWIAHGVGAMASLSIVYWMRLFIKPNIVNTASAPSWSFLGGLPGAFVVVLAVVVVNSPLGLTGALVLSIGGQVLFGLLTDQWGWFGMAARKLTKRRLMASLLILTGSLLIVFSKGNLS